MSDFQNLSPQMQSILHIKLDGLIEACVHTARSLNMGLSETMLLTIRALLREMAAHNFDRCRADQIWIQAASEALPAAGKNTTATLN